MRLTGSRVYSRPIPVPKMPPGLVELMEGLTKDVLKNNPPEVYEFCAEHMRMLLEIRDGPTNQKPLSLDQKISRAQEKVRKRAELRRRKFDSEVETKGEQFNDERRISQKISPVVDGSSTQSTVDGNIAQSTMKPVHNDLTQDSEIEISCEPVINRESKTDNDSPHSAAVADAEQLSLATPPLTEKDVNHTSVMAPNDLNDPIPVCKDVNSEFDQQNDPIPDCKDVDNEVEKQPQQNDNNNHCDVENSELDSNPNTIEMLEKDDNNIEDSKEDIQLLSSNNIEKSTKTGSDDNKSAINEEKNINESEHPNEVTALDADPVAVETDETKPGPAIALKASGKDDATHKNEHESLSIEVTKENGSENLVQTSIDDSGVAENFKAVDNTDILISKMENKEITKDLLGHDIRTQKGDIELTNEVEESATNLEKVMNKDIENVLTNEVEESATDLEKVMNEAIENTKRKDSSAYDSLKDNIVYNDESDASESSNLVSNPIALNEPPNESGASIINEIKGTKDSKETIDHDVEKISENHVTLQTAVPLRSKRSVEENNAEQANIDQDNVELSAKVLNDPISTAQQDKNVNESNNKTLKNDSANTMDLETAAVTIQKVFRTFLFKSRASTFDESVNEENNLSDDDDKKDNDFLPANNLNKERRTGISRMDTVLQTVNEEKSLSLSTDDSSLSSAATIIQAHVRGFLIRNKLNSGKSASKSSLGISNGPSSTSLDGDTDQNKNKTILNIHIVPEGGNYLSRDESMITSMDLSLDGSPPSSVNLHPLGYNTSERRKLLKREDAVQSVSPPSNNSGKLSEDVDSIKELPTIEQNPNANQEQKTTGVSLLKDDSQQDTEVVSLETTPTSSLTVETVVAVEKILNTELMTSPEPNTDASDKTKKNLTKQSSDEMDVVTPYKENSSIANTKLIHSGEFHDSALPTKVSRSDTPVVSEFKNVLVYFLLWNNS